MPSVAILSNCQWNIAHFRAPLVDAWRARGWRVVAIAPFDGSEERLKALGVETVAIAMERGGLSPVADARLAYAYRKALKAAQVDLVAAFTIKPNIYGSLAARTLGLPVINNVSGLGTAFLSRRWLELAVRGLYRMGLEASSAVFFQNEDDRDRFVTDGLVRASQARLVHGSGVDLNEFAAKPMPENRPMRLLFLGRFLRDKGLVELADASRFLKAREVAVEIVLAGSHDPDNRSAIAPETVAAWQSEGLVRWLGPLADVRAAVAEADAVILPSYREGLPRSLVEAAAMGRPGLASDVPGCRQAVADGVTGLLFAAKSAEAIAEAVERFAEMDADARAAMGKAARDRAERLFGAEAVVAAYDDAIAQAVEIRKD